MAFRTLCMRRSASLPATDPAGPWGAHPALNTPWRKGGRGSILCAMRKSIAYILAPLPLVCGALVFLSGCDSEPDSHLVSAPPPSANPARTTMVTTTTSSAPVVVANPAYVTPAYVTTTSNPTVNTVIVTQAPPVPQVDVVIAQPSPQHVWLTGYWTWRDNQYEWMAGHWELPPSSNSSWTSPRGEREGNAYRFHEGYWN